MMTALPVRQYMHGPVHTIPAFETIATAQHRLEQLGISSLAVVDASGSLSGVISRSDLLRLARISHHGRVARPPVPVEQVMTRGVLSVSPDDSLSSACKLMVKRQVHRVFVEDGDTAVGVLGISQVIRAVLALGIDAPLDRYMSRPLFTIEADATLGAAAHLLTTASISGVVVVEDRQPLGVFSQTEALLCSEWPAGTRVVDVMDSAMLCLPAQTPMYRAAEQALQAGATRVIACQSGDMVGIVSGLDFARALT